MRGLTVLSVFTLVGTVFTLGLVSYNTIDNSAKAQQWLSGWTGSSEIQAAGAGLEKQSCRKDDILLKYLDNEFRATLNFLMTAEKTIKTSKNKIKVPIAQVSVNGTTFKKRVGEAIRKCLLVSGLKFELATCKGGLDPNITPKARQRSLQLACSNFESLYLRINKSKNQAAK